MSGGTYEAINHFHVKESTKKREAFFLEFAEQVASSSLRRGVQIRKNLSTIRVYVTGGFRSAEGMAQAIQEGAADGIGLGRPITAEFGGSLRDKKQYRPA